VVLCFSPVGSALRVRSRKFPALANCTNIDWFHEWPEEALLSVSQKFLSEVDLLTVTISLTELIENLYSPQTVDNNVKRKAEHHLNTTQT